MQDLFDKGIHYFNSGYFFEAHDTFEEIWMDDREDSKLFYQGLVQLSTGFYHLVMKNLKGAESQLSKGVQKLTNYEPIYEEINISRLIRQVEDCILDIEKARSEEFDFSYAELIQKIPKLRRGVH